MSLDKQLQKLKTLIKKESCFLGIALLVNLGVRLLRVNDPNFSYFDEAKYYLPAARELLASLVDTNWEHPPLAKLLIALGIKFFGDNSFGWRIFEITIASVAIVVVYFLAKKLFSKTLVVPILAVVFMTSEFAWFTTSRFAMPEIFFASFVLFSAYFFWVWFEESKPKYLRDFLTDKNFLFLSLFAGLALSTKWTGLLLILFYIFTLAYKLKGKMLLTSAAIVVLVVITLTTYIGSYAYFFQKHSLGQFIDLQTQMYDYHTKKVNEIVENNPKLKTLQNYYKAYLWPANNIFSFKYNQEHDQTKAVIFFYNPLVFWGSLVSVVYFTFSKLKKHNFKFKYLFLSMLFLLFWVPWLFSPRIVYPYYWLAGIPFGAILFAKFVEDKWGKDKYVLWGVGVLSLLLFILYYPLLSNLPVKNWYFQFLTGTIGFN